MQELAAYCEAREQLHLRVDRRDNSCVRLALESSLNTSRYGTSVVTLLVPVPSIPKSAWIGLQGERIPVDVRWAPDRDSRVIVSLPVNAKTLQFTF